MSIKYKKFKSNGYSYECAMTLKEGDVIYYNTLDLGERYYLILGKEMLYCPYNQHSWEMPVPHYFVKNMSEENSQPCWTVITKDPRTSIILVE